MATKSNLQATLEERTATITIALHRGADPAVRVERARSLVNEKDEPIAELANYALGRMIDATARDQVIELPGGGTMFLGDLVDAFIALGDKWAEEDAPIYRSGAQYERPVT